MAGLILVPAAVHANPEGGTVASGEVTISGEGTSRVVVTQTSERALIDWQRFSIGAGEFTRFIQPDATSLAANRVVGVDPSQILGRLEADGRVVLINRNGVVFGRGSRVDAAGLLATVHDLDGSVFASAPTLRFGVSGTASAAVVNEGTITVRDEGLAALVAPRVGNSGTIRAGDVTLAAARSFALDLHGDGLLRFTPGDGLLLSPGDGALVESGGRIEADGGTVRLGAYAAQAILNASVNVSGVVQARRVSQSGGEIYLEGSREMRVENGARLDASGTDGGGKVRVAAGDRFVNLGTVLAEGGTGAGGTVEITGTRVGLGGRIGSSGASGGRVTVDASGLLSLGERVEARGTSGAGGEVRYAAGRVVETAGASTDASGAADGGLITVHARSLASSGSFLASGQSGHGGFIDLGAADIRLLSATLEAKGSRSGGLVRVGGAFRGGAPQTLGTPEYTAFVGRWGMPVPLRSSDETFVNDGTVVDVSSAGGTGGTAVLWSQRRTTFLGSVDARGPTGGGAVALSSAGELRHGPSTRVQVGSGHRVVEGEVVITGEVQAVQAWSYAGVLGVANADRVPADDVEFGHSVSLNGAGNRLAVGAIGDDGAGNATRDSGAVYLFTFANSSFSGGRLAAIVGRGYTGGRNVDVAALERGDWFGDSVSLNSAGTRLAVGAHGDDGAGNVASDSGAVYLFTFSDSSFSGGRLAATVGKGYNARNVDVVALGRGDRFGHAISLNGLGTRLAVGAPYDDGADNGTRDSGAVYLFAFSDNAFSAGRLAATVGSGYTGGRNVDIDALERNVETNAEVFHDLFGASVSLNAAGTRLAVGAPGDNGAGNAVYLFTFSDDTFTDGYLAATVGRGYTVSRNLDVAALERGDRFGSAVSLNAAGTRLAVGAPGDDGTGNGTNNSGAVYLFTFSDSSFSAGGLAATLGRGYTGSRNVDVATLGRADEFGSAVSLNGTGARLAVGARGDDGAGNATGDSGAVYLFAFSDDAFSAGHLAATVGRGYNVRNVDVLALERDDGFGRSVSLNGSGTRLAVGALYDDGADNGTSDSGAVYLFTFSDDSFAGGHLAATVGRGYAGGRNLDVGALEREDNFGVSVSLNGSGTRLAVGALGDDGAGNGSRDSGAVYLFTFSDDSFAGGHLAATVGRGYAGGRSLDVAALGRDDWFGQSVSLNAAGTRLAVGASRDDGADNGTRDSGRGDGADDATRDSGAVYLFTFSDASFSGGHLAATVGRGYTGGRNVDVGRLDRDDWFGRSVSLNGPGTRLAVGTLRDDGAGNGSRDSGAVYLFTFSDASFSGGHLAATVGRGYAGGRNLDVAALERDDRFGQSVSLNAAGTRLAVGAYRDDGADNVESDSGAVYLFTFSDDSFAGGHLAATVGRGYTGGRNVDVGGLDRDDWFGRSVSLNGLGTQLAIGAPSDDGTDNGTSDSGAVYLFTFSDDTFAGGRLAATLGRGYTGGRNLDVAALGSGQWADWSGFSVWLDAAGTRLAIGAPGEGGADDATRDSGAVYLFSFADRSLAGARLEAVVGVGYVGGRNIDVTTLGE